MNEFIQLKITLQDSEPEIWRKIQVHKTTNFIELHNIIQIAMGWKNYHLFEFNSDDYRIGVPSEDFDDLETGTKEITDAIDIRLEDVVKKVGDKIEYEYDFGDGWIHEIIVEKYLEADKNNLYPICVDGKMSCPPEDCGGIHGYMNLLIIIADKTHPERKEMKEWLGRNFNPKKFDTTSVNKKLKDLDKYIRKWIRGYLGE